MKGKPPDWSSDTAYWAGYENGWAHVSLVRDPRVIRMSDVGTRARQAREGRDDVHDSAAFERGYRDGWEAWVAVENWSRPDGD